jgi:hypothetical protein
MDLLVDSLWREANTRRPTLPPSALTLDVKTTAAKKNFIIKIIKMDFWNQPLATSGTPLYFGRVSVTKPVYTIEKKRQIMSFAIHNKWKHTVHYLIGF